MENTTSIEVLAKSTEEALRIKNAEFLAKYSTDDSQIDYYTKLAMQVFEEFQIDGTYDECGVRKNVSIWFQNKKAQMELFRKHPYWNEEAKAIIFVQDELRTVDYNRAKDALCDLVNYIQDKINDHHNDGLFLGLYYALLGIYEDDLPQVSTITEEFIRRFKNNAERDIPDDIAGSFKVGAKITRFAIKCFKQWQKYDGEIIDVTTLVDDHEEGDRTYNSFDKLYAKFADTLSELMIKKITLVSLHFCDFMLMSNGNSWLSCHYINSNNIFHESHCSSYSGCYKQGCLSYALDEPSFLFYTLPATYEGEKYYREPKLNRMCCQYRDGILITGKCYPDNKTEKITRYRQIMQLIISSVEDVPNLWTFSRNIDRITTFVETDEDAAHYRDYEHPDQKPTISLCKHRTDLDAVLTIGHEAYCVHCGRSLSDVDARQLQCEKHKYSRVCSCCGRIIEEDEGLHIIDDAVYCEDCCFYCQHHGYWETNDNGVNELETPYETITVCDDALDHYFRCAECGLWYENREAHYSNGNKYCGDCRQQLKADGNWASSIEVIACDRYRIGDYALMVEHPEDVNRYTTNSDMRENYAGRIVRIMNTDTWSDNVHVTINGVDYPWVWSTNCLAGKVVGDVCLSILGKTMEEI